ncbi:MAG: hypothetical protein CNLJKLNK_00140 [Holosporales bacterium]
MVFFFIVASLALNNNVTAASRSENPHAPLVELYINYTVLYEHFFQGGFSGCLDLSPLKNVIEIKQEFLNNQKHLTKFILPPRVQKIKDYFLRACTGLKTVDLTPLTHAEEIGANFLMDCIGLTSIDLVPLASQIKISEGFLRGCKGLTRIDLSPLSRIEIIEASFLRDCIRLTSINLESFENVKNIGWSFLRGCSGLTTIDLLPLSNAIIIGKNFLRECTGLTSIDLTPLARLSVIRQGFLEGCSGLTTIDLSPLSNATFEEDFLKNCTGLTSIDLTPFNKQILILYGFLEGCTGLTTVDLSPFRLVKRIAAGFLKGCTNLRTVILPFNRLFNDVVFPPSVEVISSDIMIMKDGSVQLPHPGVNHIRSIINENFETISPSEKDLLAIKQIHKACPQFLADKSCLHCLNLYHSPFLEGLEILKQRLRFEFERSERSCFE